MVIVNSLAIVEAAAPHLDPGTVLGVGLAVIGIAISIVIWIASTHAANVTKQEGSPSAYLRRVDEEAFDRAKRIYEAAIDQLEDELRRVNSMAQELQLEVFKLNTELVNLRTRHTTREDSGSQKTISDNDAGSDGGS